MLYQDVLRQFNRGVSFVSGRPVFASSDKAERYAEQRNEIYRRYTLTGTYRAVSLHVTPVAVVKDGYLGLDFLVSVLNIDQNRKSAANQFQRSIAEAVEQNRDIDKFFHEHDFTQENDHGL